MIPLHKRPLHDWAKNIPLQIVITEKNNERINICLRSISRPYETEHEFDWHGSPIVYEEYKNRKEAITAMNQLMETYDAILGVRFYGFKPQYHLRKKYKEEGLIVPFRTTEQFEQLFKEKIKQT